MPYKAEKKALQKQYFIDIKSKAIPQWTQCYICHKPRHIFVPVEDIPMPVCKDHA